MCYYAIMGSSPREDSMTAQPKRTRTESQKVESRSDLQKTTTRSTRAAETPAPAGYRLTPAAEEHLQRIAAALQVKPDVLVEVAVREWCAAWQG